MQQIEAFVKSLEVEIKIIPNTRGWIIFKFQNEMDCEKILLGGPYSFGKVSLILKKADKDFGFQKDDFLKRPVWIKVEYIPPSMWHEKGLSMIASTLGNPICTDEVTDHGERYSFARFLVEVDATETPLHHVNCYLPSGKNLKLPVTYEAFPSYCCFCKIHGHNPWQCYKDEKGKLAPLMARRVPQKSAVPPRVKAPTSANGAPAELNKEKPAVQRESKPTNSHIWYDDMGGAIRKKNTSTNTHIWYDESLDQLEEEEEDTRIQEPLNNEKWTVVEKKRKKKQGNLQIKRGAEGAGTSYQNALANQQVDPQQTKQGGFSLCFEDDEDEHQPQAQDGTLMSDDEDNLLMEPPKQGSTNVQEQSNYSPKSDENLNKSKSGGGAKTSLVEQ